MLKLTFFETIKGLDLAYSQLWACLCQNGGGFTFWLLSRLKVEGPGDGEPVFLLLEAAAELARLATRVNGCPPIDENVGVEMLGKWLSIF